VGKGKHRLAGATGLVSKRPRNDVKRSGKGHCGLVRGWALARRAGGQEIKPGWVRTNEGPRIQNVRPDSEMGIEEEAFRG